MKHLSLTGIDRQTENDDLLDDWCLSHDEIHSDSIDRKKIVGQFTYEKDFHTTASKFTSQAFYSILPKLSEQLNQKCAKRFPDTFWEILVGAWLRQYLDVLYQRFEQLKTSPIENYSVMLILECDEEIASTSDNFSVMLMQDKLNHQLMGQIIVEEGLCTYSYLKTINTLNNSEKIGRRKRNPWVLKIASLISVIITKNAGSIICNSYMSKQIVFKGIIKKLWTPLIYPPKFGKNHREIDRSARWSYFSPDKKEFSNDFEKLAFKLIARNIPTIFFEDLSDLIEGAQKTYPKKMTKFITANPNSLGELVKAWVGLAKIHNNCQYIVLQHGSNYGQSEVNTDEEVELSVCDNFLTSGWASKKFDDKYNVSVTPAPSAAGLSGIGNYLLKKTAMPKTTASILVLASFPRYYYTGWSAPQASSFRGYLDDLVLLNSMLLDDVKRKMLCRDYHYDYGWRDKQMLQSHGYKFPRGKKREPLTRLMKKSGINIFSYNSTAFLESMANNYITCAFWREEAWAWRIEARPYLLQLKEAGVYHDTPESLANFLNNFRTTEQLYNWWNLDKTKNARLSFCKEFANTEGDELDVCQKIMGNG
ncbi:LIC12162 family protein [Planktomarina sp.]|nr:LIC12162 family protein [Planktomarina sp.]